MRLFIYKRKCLRTVAANGTLVSEVLGFSMVDIDTGSVYEVEKDKVVDLLNNKANILNASLYAYDKNEVSIDTYACSEADIYNVIVGSGGSVIKESNKKYLAVAEMDTAERGKIVVLISPAGRTKVVDLKEFEAMQGRVINYRSVVNKDYIYTYLGNQALRETDTIENLRNKVLNGTSTLKEWYEYYYRLGFMPSLEDSNSETVKYSEIDENRRYTINCFNVLRGSIDEIVFHKNLFQNKLTSYNLFIFTDKVKGTLEIGKITIPSNWNRMCLKAYNRDKVHIKELYIENDGRTEEQFSSGDGFQADSIKVDKFNMPKCKILESFPRFDTTQLVVIDGYEEVIQAETCLANEVVVRNVNKLTECFHMSKPAKIDVDCNIVVGSFRLCGATELKIKAKEVIDSFKSNSFVSLDLSGITDKLFGSFNLCKSLRQVTIRERLIEFGDSFNDSNLVTHKSLKIAADKLILPINEEIIDITNKQDFEELNEWNTAVPREVQIPSFVKRLNMRFGVKKQVRDFESDRLESIGENVFELSSVNRIDYNKLPLITEVCSYTFKQCRIKKIILSHNITSIKSEAFALLTGTLILLGDNIEFIDETAFKCDTDGNNVFVYYLRGSKTSQTLRAAMKNSKYIFQAIESYDRKLSELGFRIPNRVKERFAVNEFTNHPVLNFIVGDKLTHDYEKILSMYNRVYESYGVDYDFDIMKFAKFRLHSIGGLEHSGEVIYTFALKALYSGISKLCTELTMCYTVDSIANLITNSDDLNVIYHYGCCKVVSYVINSAGIDGLQLEKELKTYVYLITALDSVIGVYASCNDLFDMTGVNCNRIGSKTASFVPTEHCVSSTADMICVNDKLGNKISGLEICGDMMVNPSLTVSKTGATIRTILSDIVCIKDIVVGKSKADRIPKRWRNGEDDKGIRYNYTIGSILYSMQYDRFIITERQMLSKAIDLEVGQRCPAGFNDFALVKNVILNGTDEYNHLITSYRQQAFNKNTMWAVVSTIADKSVVAKAFNKSENFVQVLNKDEYVLKALEEVRQQYEVNDTEFTNNILLELGLLEEVNSDYRQSIEDGLYRVYYKNYLLKSGYSIVVIGDKSYLKDANGSRTIGALCRRVNRSSESLIDNIEAIINRHLDGNSKIYLEYKCCDAEYYSKYGALQEIASFIEVNGTRLYFKSIIHCLMFVGMFNRISQFNERKVLSEIKEHVLNGTHSKYPMSIEVYKLYEMFANRSV